MRTIAIMNNKGGVGKTVTAINLADILVREHGKRVVLVDCDGQRNLTDFLLPCGYDEETCYSTVSLLTGGGEPVWSDNLTPIRPGLSLIPGSSDLYDLDLESHRDAAHEPLRVVEFVKAAREDGDTDFFLFDCPPGFTLASVGALMAADEVIVPLTVDGFSIRGLDTMQKQLRRLRRLGPKHLKVLITQWNRSKSAMGGERLLRESGVPMFQTVIPRTVKVVESTMMGETLQELSPGCSAMKAYQVFAAELLEGGARNG